MVEYVVPEPVIPVTVEVAQLSVEYRKYTPCPVGNDPLIVAVIATASFTVGLTGLCETVFTVAEAPLNSKNTQVPVGVIPAFNVLKTYRLVKLDTLLYQAPSSVQLTTEVFLVFGVTAISLPPPT